MTNEKKTRKDDDSITIKLSKNQLIGILIPFMFILGLVTGYFLWEYQGKETTELADNGQTAQETSPPDGQEAPPPTQPAADPPVQGPSRTTVEVLDRDPAYGPEDAPITIIEYSDFECPFCKRHFDETYGKINEAYEGQIRYIFKHFPLISIHPDALPAANASLCADEQGAFWPYHDYLFSGELGLNKEAFLAYAERLSLDMDEFTACVEDNRYEAQVLADMEIAHSLGVEATPTFFINGIMLEGAYPFENFVQIIDAELSGTTDSGGSGQTGQGTPSPPQEVTRYEVEILDTDPTYGPEDAPITIVEFSDFECPYCQRHFDETYGVINDTYGEQIRYVFKHFPLTSIHPAAMSAHVASMCADEQDAFWTFHDLLFSDELGLNKEAYLAYAERLSLDMDGFTACVEENRYEAQILAEMQTSIDLGVRSTPTFFINGIAIEGAYPFESFAEVIDLELAAAEGD